MRILISSHYSLLHSIDAADPQLVDLTALIARWHPERIRRIDRYIQLCLAGGLNCVAGRQLPADTGVYLSTNSGAISTPSATMRHIQQQGELPKPLHFVNTLSNSAGYYLTRLLQLNGNAVMVSDSDTSFEAALLHAGMDLLAGRVSTALVGAFDDIAMPIAQQLERMHAPADTASVYEGSHWLLLELAHDSAAQTQMELPCYLNGAGQLAAWLEQNDGLPIQLGFSPDSGEQELLANRRWQAFPAQALPHGVFSGAALTALVADNQSAIHLGKKASGQYCAVVISAAP
ncbi:hypothetical protein HG264_16525 [Pseudomonas sp. gcc21]|uniref:beta-ketoacyl synthase N-terminal-like domain-containing protein n=1 Tax=Pseudomonas sp. gcc21 TaxID=2726989 RepID=UPI001452340C|nr:beta-ketoacyl synthase N-terminal-like domain-containing protein [Pseudomonas sp. gcc21]QJD60364.1 hypothetical protein HG264_16525 [Pseudomonas sp. gcc21]